MHGYIANTDLDWFDFLAGRADDEVNFWMPSTRGFKALTVGEPLIFRLKAPRNRIGGFGIFERFSLLPDWLAWPTFGPANGAPTPEVMTARLGAIRQRNAIDGPRIVGCIVLAQPVFLPSPLQPAVPPSWHPNIVSGKGYNLNEGEGAALWRALREGAAMHAVGLDEPVLAAERYGAEVPVRPRLGQAGFRLAVLEAYCRGCAVTREHSLPALEAAHIRPYADGGVHDVTNGLLLRSDIHRLYDCGYVTVTPDHRFRVSRRLKADFDNGRSYYHLAGERVWVPEDPELRPDPRALEWHADARYLG